MRLASLLAVLLWGVTCGAAAGEVYRWVDEQGTVHFGDRPGHGDGAEAVTVKPSSVGGGVPSSDAERREKTHKLLRAWEEERRMAAEQAAEAARERQQRQRNCAKARDELKHIMAGTRYYNLDGQGGRRYLSDDENRAHAARWHEQVNYWCD